jgi:hypothetical protein
MPKEPLKIISLDVQNVMRIKAVRICPNGTALVRIEGKNSNGKSSLLKAIEMASAPDRPVRNGAKNAQVILDLGELVVTRRWSAGGSTNLEVRAKDGTKLATPQQVLDALYGEMIDPVAFQRMKPAEQAAELRRLVGLDFTEQDDESAKLYEERTGINRDHKAASARLPAPVVLAPGAPEEPVSVADLSRQLEEAHRHNGSLQKRREALEAQKKRFHALKAEAQAMLERAQAITKEAEELAASGKAEGIALSQEQPIDTAAITAQIGSAESVNRMLAQRDERRRLQAEVDGLAKKADTLTDRMERLAEAKAAALERATYPVEGLGIDGDVVTLNGLPFSQASSSEQLRAGVAIGMAQNPRLRVMLVREGSLLDEAALKDLEAIANQHDAQVFIERVADHASPAAVVIEDGEAVSMPAEMHEQK